MTWLLEQQLDELKKQVTKQGWYVEDTLRLTAEAIRERNAEAGSLVKSHFWDIFNTYLDIVGFSQVISASFGPQGKHLRFVFGSVLISKALLDIAERLDDIAEITSRLLKEPELSQSVTLGEMFSLAQRMLRKALRIYVDQNVEGAASVCSQDSFVDRAYERLRDELTSIMKENGRLVSRGVLLLEIARAIGEVSDFAVQIIEVTFYIQRGKFHRCFGNELREFSLADFKEMVRDSEGFV